jgi:hypothetical protein
MFIYMNERTINRLKNTKSKLKFADINVDETDLCEMKDKLLQEEISLTVSIMTTSMTFTVLKRSTSQIMTNDATRS